MIYLLKMQLPLRGILISLPVVLVLGLSASGVLPLTGMNNGLISFSGQISNVALNPQPEPPAPYEIGSKAGKGLFSGQIMTVSLNPQPEPPLPYDIEKNNFRGIFSGQVQTVTINPQPEPPGVGSVIGINTGH